MATSFQVAGHSSREINTSKEYLANTNTWTKPGDNFEDMEILQKGKNYADARTAGSLFVHVGSTHRRRSSTYQDFVLFDDEPEFEEYSHDFSARPQRPTSVRGPTVQTSDPFLAGISGGDTRYGDNPYQYTLFAHGSRPDFESIPEIHQVSPETLQILSNPAYSQSQGSQSHNPPPSQANTPQYYNAPCTTSLLDSWAHTYERHEYNAVQAECSHPHRSAPERQR